MQVLFIILNNQFSFAVLWRVEGVPKLASFGHGLPRFARNDKPVDEGVVACSDALQTWITTLRSQ
ncbi:hypothetical protein [Limnohabitans planktonicus]|uniref:Uncharacterized protein n=1 Tax=Limnohabitans planktonicus II-D5 TaxID=1293045 RepID=A0A2T7U8W8_9BURK|nr:hypothetical protein [Limnohabitans planktonicus]PVE41138.1 hypothetical protein H663_018660 [Limnohabitans planktonicus II-D5]